MFTTRKNRKERVPIPKREGCPAVTVSDNRYFRTIHNHQPNRANLKITKNQYDETKLKLFEFVFFFFIDIFFNLITN